MIDFNASQLTWIVIGACSMGGTGYLSMNTKIDDLDKKVAVSINTTEHTIKSIEDLQKSLTRIEEKLDKRTSTDK
jgi:hypothetical protein